MVTFLRVCCSTVMVVVAAVMAFLAGCSEGDESSGGGRSGAGSGGGGSGGSAAAGGTSGSGGGSGVGGSNVGSDAGSEAQASPEPGSYMGTCTGDGGSVCNEGLHCVQWVEFSGGSGRGGRYCTHSCDAGCPPPSPGCDNDICDHI